MRHPPEASDQGHRTPVLHFPLSLSCKENAQEKILRRFLEKLCCKIHERVGIAESVLHMWDCVADNACGHPGLLFALGHLGALPTSQESVGGGVISMCPFAMVPGAHSGPRDIGAGKLFSPFQSSKLMKTDDYYMIHSHGSPQQL